MKYTFALALLIGYAPATHTATIKSVKSWIAKNITAVAGGAAMILCVGAYVKYRPNNEYQPLMNDPFEKINGKNKHLDCKTPSHEEQRFSIFHTPKNRNVHIPPLKTPDAPKKSSSYLPKTTSGMLPNAYDDERGSNQSLVSLIETSEPTSPIVFEPLNGSGTTPRTYHKSPRLSLFHYPNPIERRNSAPSRVNFKNQTTTIIK